MKNKDEYPGYNNIKRYLIPRSQFEYTKKSRLLSYLLRIETTILRVLGYTTDRKDSWYCSILNRIMMGFFKLIGRFTFFPSLLANNTLSTRGHLVPIDNEYLDITLRYDTRSAIVAEPEQSVLTKGFVGEDAIFKVGVAILGGVDPRALGGDCVISTVVKGKETEKDFSFKLPVDTRNKEISYSLGQGWVDFKYDLSEFKDQDVQIELKNGFEKDRQRINMVSVPSIAWSSPQIICHKDREQNKRIIIMSFDSISDLLFFKQAKLPSFNSFISDSTLYKRSYSQGDSTLSSAGSILTGLYPSQHWVVDYNSIKNRLSDRVKTFAQIVKEKNICTTAVSHWIRRNPGYGWARGFDSYYNPPWNSDIIPDIGWITRQVDIMKETGGLLFAHMMLPHEPYAMFVNSYNPHLLDAGLLSNIDDKDNALDMYSKKLEHADTVFSHLIHELKVTGQYDDALVILTSDHGSCLFPWGEHGEYALYEQRIRVPFIVKYPNGCGKEHIINKPHNACSGILPIVTDFTGCSVPEYFKKLPQNDSAFDGLAISETMMHPTKDDYVISVVSEMFKYLRFGKIDLKNICLKNFYEEKLYPVDNTGVVLEDFDISSENRDVVKEMRYLVDLFLEKNLKFQKEYRTRGSWTPEKK